jgi:hypothetical protein
MQLEILLMIMLSGLGVVFGVCNLVFRTPSQWEIMQERIDHDMEMLELEIKSMEMYLEYLTKPLNIHQLKPIEESNEQKTT